MPGDGHTDVITRVIAKEFGEDAGEVRRMSNGICNEVYAVDLSDRRVVVRLHEHARYMYGSHNHIPIFRERGITVPEILAEDYSKETVPFAYQVLSWTDGQDIKDVIDTLSPAELGALAGEISKILDALRDLPNDGRFGVLWGDGDDLLDSWSAVIRGMSNTVMGWGRKTGVLDEELENILEWINSEYRNYFRDVRPITYYSDMCAKNVLVHNGRFAGLVDLDALAQGDPLDTIGRIKASWYGTEHGRIYTDAVMDAQRLNTDQRIIVTMYALLNRTYWTMENGIQFNQNTSTEVDPEREAQDRAVVRALYSELRGV